VRLLALDPGQDISGAAYFDGGRLVSIDRFKSRGTDWLPKLESIAADLRQAARGRSWLPDFVAIELPTPGLHFQANASLGETRGYLQHEVRSLWPKVRIVDVHPSTHGALAGGRAGLDRKDATKAFVIEVLDRHGLPRPQGGLDQNTADAVSIGIAAHWKLGAEVVGVERAKATGWRAVVFGGADANQGMGEQVVI